MKTWLKAVLSISLSFMCVFNCFGYAKITGTISIYGAVEAPDPYAIIITSITSEESVAGAGALVNSYIGTTANLSVGLGADPSSSQTLRVTLFNNTKDYFLFKGVEYLEDELAYSNENIVLETEVVSIGEEDKFAPETYAILDITFKYKEYRGSPEELSALLSFRFGLTGEAEGTDYESYISYFLTNTKGYGINDSHKGHVVLNNLFKYKLLYAKDSVTSGNLKQLLSAINTNQTSNLTFVYEYVNETKILLYTYEEKYNSSDYNNESVIAYQTTFTRSLAEGGEYTEWGVTASRSGTATVKYMPTPAGSNLYAIDVHTWNQNTSN